MADETTDARGIALDAIQYVLRRAQSEPEGLGRHLDPFTEAWGRLVAAEAELTGEPLEDVRARRRKRLEARRG